MDRWRGRTALVTGASSGIGYAIAEELSKQGMNVVTCARRLDRLEELANMQQHDHPEQGRLTAIKCDLTNEECILGMFQRIEQEFHHVDVLINNAGTLTDDDLLTGKTEGWRQMLDLNILGLSICAREALCLMSKNNVDDGHIININSIGGHIDSAPGTNSFDFYNGTKHMVTAMTKALNAELRQMKIKIRATSISPGYVDTEIWKFEETADPEHLKMVKAIRSSTPLSSQDIADAVVYAIGTPGHVNIRELTICPIDQA